jgi:hypothetical protein
MAETTGMFNSLRDETRAVEIRLGLRIDAVSNELHRHQDEAKVNNMQTSSSISRIDETIARWEGNLNGSLTTFKWVAGVPAFLAAVFGLVNLIRHW